MVTIPLMIRAGGLDATFKRSIQDLSTALRQWVTYRSTEEIIKLVYFKLHWNISLM